MATKNSLFTDNLKKIIADLKMSNREFAEKAKIGYSTIMTYLNENNYGHVAEWDILIKISKASGKSIDWLLTGEEKGQTGQKEPCPIDCNDRMKPWCHKVKNIMAKDETLSSQLKSSITIYEKHIQLEENQKNLENRMKNLEKISGKPPGTRKTA